MTNNDLPLVWIEWGRKIPRYLVNNINLHINMFPEQQQFLLSDFQTTRIEHTGVISQFSLDKIPHSDFLMRFDEISSSKISKYSQKNFWIGTTRRFFLLHDFMQHFRLTKAIHVESDNVILDLQEVRKYCQQGVWSLAYPMQSKSLGCGSIFIVQNIDGLREFLGFILDNWADPMSNDMTLLGSFSDRREVVEILPSWPTGDITFDPGAYGKFFLGSDARNFRFPTRRRGVISEDSTSLLNQMPRTIVSLEKGMPSRIVLNGRTKLLNLHVHSKVIPNQIEGLNRMLRKSISTKRSFLWRKGRLDTLVISERVLTRFVRIFCPDRDIRFR